MIGRDVAEERNRRSEAFAAIGRRRTTADSSQQAVPNPGAATPRWRIVDDTAFNGGRGLTCYVGDTKIGTATLLPESTEFGDFRWSVLLWPALEQVAGTRAVESVVLDEDDARQSLGFLAGLYVAVHSREARMIRTVDQLDALPDDAVVRDGEGAVQVHADKWFQPGWTGGRVAAEVPLPALLIHHPDWSET